MRNAERERIEAENRDRRLLKTGWLIVGSAVGGVLFLFLMAVLFTSGEPLPSPPPPRRSLDPLALLRSKSSLDPATLAVCLAEFERRRREGRPVSLSPPAARKLLEHYRSALPGFRYALAILRTAGIEPDPAETWKIFLARAADSLAKGYSPDMLRRTSEWLRAFRPVSLPSVSAFDRALAELLTLVQEACERGVPNAPRARLELLKAAALHEGGRGDAPLLMKALRRAFPGMDEAARSAAAEIFARFMTKEDLPVLHRAVTNPETSDAVYIALVRALADFGDPSSLRAVLSSLSLHSEGIIASVLPLLGAWDLTGRLRVIFKFVRSKNRFVASAALRALSASPRNAAALAASLPDILPTLPPATACEAVAALAEVPLDKLPLDVLLDFAAKGDVQKEAVAGLLAGKGFRKVAAAFHVPLAPLSLPASARRPKVLADLLVACADAEAGEVAVRSYKKLAKGNPDRSSLELCLRVAATAWRKTGDSRFRDFLRSAAASAPLPPLRETAVRLLRSDNNR